MPPSIAGQQPRSRAKAGHYITALAVGLAAVLLSAPAAQASPTITAVAITSTGTAAAGDTFVATVNAGTVDDLYAYDLTVTFDPAMLQFESAAFPDGGFGSVDQNAGTVHLLYTRLGTSPGLAASGLTIASLTFKALTAGTATISATNIASVGADGETLSTSLTALTATVLTAKEAPLAQGGWSSSSGWLLGAALALVAAGSALLIRRKVAAR
jgi:hypothetical protein